MRIVIDMQGAQTESRFRGIGRYSLAFAQGIARNRGPHEVILVLNGLFPSTIDPISDAFRGLLPRGNIRVWSAPGPTREADRAAETQRQTAEVVREAFIRSLCPDVVHLTSLFEGFVDDAVTSVHGFDSETIVSTSLYDLIPLLNSDQYLAPNPDYKRYYERKIGYLRQADLLLAISEYSAEEARRHLGSVAGDIVNVSAAIEQCFVPTEVPEVARQNLLDRFGVDRPFLLYTGGSDERKNLPRLLQAFAVLPEPVRQGHQLLLAGKFSDGCLKRFASDIKVLGLSESSVRFSGYVSDEELVALYSLCKLFVFPSWHEGFGLPALEAMACGAAVIASNATSIPEVVSIPDALFDPMNVNEIASKMLMALTDEGFRQCLREQAATLSGRFSWDISAKRAIAAFEGVMAQRSTMDRIVPRRARMALVTPLPPDRTGIADYCAELLPALAEYYEIDVIVARPHAMGFWGLGKFPIRSEEWFRSNFHLFDRVLYQVGNSPFHDHMLQLMKDVPGVVMLHDFFLSGLMMWRELANGDHHAWSRALYDSHGMEPLAKRFSGCDLEEMKANYPANFGVVSAALGVLLTSNYSRDLVTRWYDGVDVSRLKVVPMLKPVVGVKHRCEAKKELFGQASKFLVCSFGFLDQTKLNHRIIKSWIDSPLSRSNDCMLVFVGENHGGDYGENLRKAIAESGCGDRIRITGYADTELFKTYLAAADVAVQLRTGTRGETSAAIYDCMAHGVPLIINSHGPMAEIDRDAVWMLEDCFTDQSLCEALDVLWKDRDRRELLGKRGLDLVASSHTPDIIAGRYHTEIEFIYGRARFDLSVLVKRLGQLEMKQADDTALSALAESLALDFPNKKPRNRILLDVTATSSNDLRTGIERVARAVSLELLKKAPVNMRVELVRLCHENGTWVHRYANKFALSLLSCDPDILEDEVVEASIGDILINLDLSDKFPPAERSGFYEDYRRRGVECHAVVFDVLPVTMPDVFPPGAHVGHSEWIDSVSRLDGAICISRAVQNELQSWLRSKGGGQRVEGNVSWFHLGADLSASFPTLGMPDNAYALLDRLRRSPTFLMVGTIEPRKGHLQVLAAFSQLWAAGVSVNLVIVGKEGWPALPDDMRRTIPGIVSSIRGHERLGMNLHWIEMASDEFVDALYSASACLIAASEGEGFGLPLIEAAQHKLPIIARDIPVFREVAGEHASYFSGHEAAALSSAIQVWLARYEAGTHTKSDELPWLTWGDSARQLLQSVALIPGLGSQRRNSDGESGGKHEAITEL
ncbi:glycosyltransferase [Niveibacterium sp. COAC-50]|uniref:glycosyltransferase n=1 Tax=Niveibacterium sp. COAC-50 TaxID=2729384 RepID=UPI00155781D9|nr:glycosyltransferase [Niveibacterium sp. COAC-50]